MHGPRRHRKRPGLTLLRPGRSVGRAIRADLADHADHGQAVDLVARVRPDAVVHTAGIPEPFQDTEVAVFDTNVPVLFHVCEAVRTAR